MFHSIRWRIALPYVLLILVVITGLGFYLSTYIQDTYLENLEGELVAETRLLADSLQQETQGVMDPGIVDPMAKHWAGLLGKRVTIIAADGTVVGESGEDFRTMQNHLNRPEVAQALASEYGSTTRYSSTLRYSLMYVAVKVGDSQAPLGVVRLAVPLEQVEQDLAHLQRTLSGAAVVTAVLAIFLATWIAGRTTRPIRQLTEAAGQLSGGDLESRIIPSTQDEVGQLTQAFNLMAVQLRAQIDALESERSKLAAILSEMSDGVLIVDAQGRVQMSNPAAENIFGFSGRPIHGYSFAEVVRHHQLVDLWKLTQESREPQVTTVEFGARRLYLQCVTTPFGEALPGSTLVLVQNLTRVRHLETVRRDFISNISHELRTPLASLKALTETLQEGALEDPPAARRFLQRMETEVDALSMMVSELLELARIESGRVPLQLSLTSPCDLAHHAAERLRLQAERSELRLEIDCPEETRPVLVDPPRLEQALVNLIHNAIKFTPAGGLIRVQVVEEKGAILLQVVDTGIGIPAEDLPRIFERFFKADRARSSGGTGLGLAIARHLVEAHSGKIWVTSTPGQGSTFSIWLPFAQ